MKVKSLSRLRLLATPWTAAHQAPPSMGFSRQEYWSGVPLPSPELMDRKVANEFLSDKRRLSFIYIKMFQTIFIKQLQYVATLLKRNSGVTVNYSDFPDFKRKIK